MLKLFFTIAIFTPALSSAHAHIIKASPAKESVVTSAPKEISIEFSEILETSMSKIEVKNLSTGEFVSGKTYAGNEQNILLANLDNLRPNKTKFEVSWKAVTKDSHTMKGTYTFTLDPAVKK